MDGSALGLFTNIRYTLRFQQLLHIRKKTIVTIKSNRRNKHYSVISDIQVGPYSEW